MTGSVADRLLKSFYVRSFYITLAGALILALGLPYIRTLANETAFKNDTADLIHRFVDRELNFDFNDLLTHPQAHTDMFRRLDLFMAYSNLVDFKIWTTDQVLAYAFSDKSKVGERFQDNPELREALESGDVEFEFEQMGKTENLDLHDRGKLLELYVPVRHDGRIAGVIEIYRKLPLSSSALVQDLSVASGALLLPLLLFLFLYGQFSLAAKELVRNNRRLDMTNQALTSSYMDAIRSLTSALELRDKETEGHSERVVALSVLIGQRMGLDQDVLVRLVIGAYLHDVGKIGVPDSILLKPGRLTDEERSVMQTHVRKGLEIIGKIGFLEEGKEVVAGHHERFEGGGYPQGISGEEIPLTARIFALVDVFDALRSKRPYKDPFSYEESSRIIREDAGRHFDPAVVEAFQSIREEEIDALNKAVETGGIHHLVSEATQHLSNYAVKIFAAEADNGNGSRRSA